MIVYPYILTPGERGVISDSQKSIHSNSGPLTYRFLSA